MVRVGITVQLIYGFLNPIASINHFQSRIHRSSYYYHAMFILLNKMDHTLKHDDHSMIIL